MGGLNGGDVRSPRIPSQLLAETIGFRSNDQSRRPTPINLRVRDLTPRVRREELASPVIELRRRLLKRKNKEEPAVVWFFAIVCRVCRVACLRQVSSKKKSTGSQRKRDKHGGAGNTA